MVFCIVTPPSLAVAGHHHFTPEHDLNDASSRMWFSNSEAHRQSSHHFDSLNTYKNK